MPHRTIRTATTVPTRSVAGRSGRALRRSAAVLLLGGFAASSCTPPPAALDTPTTSDVAVSGDAAVEALGPQLDEAANAAGLAPAEVVNELREDETLKVDETDRLFYEEPELSAEAVRATGSASWPTSPKHPPATTFRLHSRSSAAKKIYLDFTGHTTSGSEWNKQYGSPIASARWNLVGSDTTYTTAEHAFIQNVFDAVADDFSSFDVDVTTAEPSGFAGVRVVISPTASWYPKRVGGVAYIGSFRWGTSANNPAFVFAEASDSPKFVAEAASHEIGHTLGLKHDGWKDAAGKVHDYYGGHGDWAPIMGVGYSKPVTQWSKGEYSGATNAQDDIATITSSVSRLADDYANTPQDWIAGAVLPGLEQLQFGAIQHAGDIDVRLFCFHAATTVKVVPSNNDRVAGNVNLSAKITLLGQVKASSSPTTSLEAELRVPSPGCYQLFVEGAGHGSNASTGFTNYGSIGAYTIIMK